jgi:ubiquitin-protein ligase
MEDEYENYEYNDYETAYCPNCHAEVGSDLLDSHMASCSNVDKTTGHFSCEICKEEVLEDPEYEKYTDHLLINHSVEEIEKKVRIQKVLLNFGINKVIPIISDSYADAQLIDYNMIQCKLCENIVANIMEQKKKHIHHFHRGQFLDDYFNCFDNAFSFKSNIQFSLCNQCGVYMENYYALTILHDHVIHSKLMKNTQLSIPMLFCNKCNMVCEEEDHIHISFLSANKKETPLVTEFYKATQKIKGLTSDKNILPEYYQAYKTPDGAMADIIALANEIEYNIRGTTDNGNHFIGKYIIPSKVSLLDLMNSWNIYISIHRKIPQLILDKYQDLGNNKFAYSQFMSLEMHYFSKETKSTNSRLLTRLKNEFDLIYDHIPFDFNSSYFVRADSSYPQFTKLLIIGPRGTPYEHGLFLFDIYFPEEYPTYPPKIRFMTTGSGNFRFSPLIDRAGKICLSLIGGWSNSGERENWNPKSSNLSQIIIAFTQLLFSDRIIESEPGHESSMSNVLGIYQNEAFANIVRCNNIQYAILDNIKDSPLEIAFGHLIHDYFSIRAIEIVEDVKIWLKRCDKTCAMYEGITKYYNKEWCELLSSSANCYFNTILTRLEAMMLALSDKGYLNRFI